MKYWNVPRVVGTAMAVALMLVTANVLAVPTDFRVKASGDVSGVTDRVNIQAAIDRAKYSGAEATVLLSKGTFYTDGPLELVNGCISIRGRGIGETVITNAPGMVFGSEPWSPFIQVSLSPDWDSERVCDFAIADLSIHARGTTGHQEIEGGVAWDVPAEAGISITGKPDAGPGDVAKYRARISRVEIVGELGENYLWGSNILWGIATWPHWTSRHWSLSMDLVISDCRFEDEFGSVGQGALVDSHFVFANNTVRWPGGVPANFSGRSAEFGDASNSLIEVRDNDIDGGWNMLVRNGWNWPRGGDDFLPEPSTWIIQNNRIRTVGDYPLDVRDYPNTRGGVRTMTVVITGNDLISEDARGSHAGAVYLRFADGGVVAFNRISGYSAAPDHGIPISVRGKDNFIAFNDTTGFSTHPDWPYGVWLWDTTANNVVAESGPVLDETDDPSTPEYDGNNTIIP